MALAPVVVLVVLILSLIAIANTSPPSPRPGTVKRVVAFVLLVLIAFFARVCAHRYAPPPFGDATGCGCLGQQNGKAAGQLPFQV
jgi:hypothetical protein